MVCCIRQSATGDPPIGRGPSKRTLRYTIVSFMGRAIISFIVLLRVEFHFELLLLSYLSYFHLVDNC